MFSQSIEKKHESFATAFVPSLGEYPLTEVTYQTLILNSFISKKNGPDIIDVEKIPLQLREALPLLLGKEKASNRSDVKDDKSGKGDKKSQNPTPPSDISPATGILLTYRHTWLSDGLAIGPLQHVIGLAPGEIVRTAVHSSQDKATSRRTELADENTHLQNTMTHGRSINEITQAIAHEASSGFSQFNGVSSTYSEGGGAGFSFLGLAGGGGSSVFSESTNQITGYTVSQGQRDLGSSLSQNIHERIQQFASAARNRNATVIEEQSLTNTESSMTGGVVNYNRMHTLNIQYYQVLQIYKAILQLSQVEKCFFYPIKPLNFNDPLVVDSYLKQVKIGYGYEAKYFVDGKLTSAPTDLIHKLASIEVIENDAIFSNPRRKIIKLDLKDSKKNTNLPISGSERIIAIKCWNSFISEEEYKTKIAQNSFRLVPVDEKIVPSSATIETVNIEHRYFCAIKSKKTQKYHSMSSTQVIGMQFKDIEEISIGTAVDYEDDAKEVSPKFTPNLLIQFDTTDFYIQSCMPKADRVQSRLLRAALILNIKPSTKIPESFPNILQLNRTYHTHQFYRSLGPAKITALLANKTYDGQPLLKQIDPNPLTVVGNYLVFKMGGVSNPYLYETKLEEERNIFFSKEELTKLKSRNDQKKSFNKELLGSNPLVGIQSKNTKKLTGYIDGKEIVFDEIVSEGDGYCGFYSIGVSPEDVVNILLAQENNLAARNELRTEIRNEVVKDILLNSYKQWSKLGLAEEIVTAYRNCQDNRNAALNAAYEHARTQLDRFCLQAIVFRKYVENLRQGWIGYKSAKLVAQFSPKPFNLYIWEKDTQSQHADSIRIKDFYVNPHVVDVKHIYHTNTHTHFNFLVQSEKKSPKPAPAEKKASPKPVINKSDFTLEEELYDWMDKNKLNWHTRQEETVAIPTGGLHAEGPLGRGILAEKFDMTRFENWEDSPLDNDLTPEIAPLQMGRSNPLADISPVQFSPYLLQMLKSAHLPDPVNMQTVLNTLTKRNMFRDMSGKQYAAELSKKMIQATGATERKVASDATRNHAVVVKDNIEFLNSLQQMVGGESTDTSRLGSIINMSEEIDEEINSSNEQEVSDEDVASQPEADNRTQPLAEEEKVAYKNYRHLLFDAMQSNTPLKRASHVQSVNYPQKLKLRGDYDAKSAIQKKITHDEYIQLAYHAQREDKLPNHWRLPEPWTKNFTLSHPQLGSDVPRFFGVTPNHRINVYVNQESKKIVIGVQGTRWEDNTNHLPNFTNILDDINIFLQKIPMQLFNIATLIIKGIHQKYPGFEISYTGYSLGAAVASILAAHAGAEAVVFDSPGVQQMFEKYPYSNLDSASTNRITIYQAAFPNLVNQYGTQLEGAKKITLQFSSEISKLLEGKANKRNILSHDIDYILSATQFNIPSKKLPAPK